MLFHGSTALGTKKRFFGKFRATVGAEDNALGIGIDTGLCCLFFEALALLLLLAICLHITLQSIRTAFPSIPS
jgi:hypothetical protein